MSDRVDNPFRRGVYYGHQTYFVTVDDRVRAVRDFDRAQCEAALRVDGLQRAVERAVRARLRLIDKADGLRAAVPPALTAYRRPRKIGRLRKIGP